MQNKLTKLQVRRLIAGGYVTDGQGKRYSAGEDIKARLKVIDGRDLYDIADVYLDDTGTVRIVITDWEADEDE